MLHRDADQGGAVTHFLKSVTDPLSKALQYIIQTALPTDHLISITVTVTVTVTVLQYYSYSYSYSYSYTYSYSYSITVTVTVTVTVRHDAVLSTN